MAPHQTEAGFLADAAESARLEQEQLSRALPKTLTAYRNHELYALKRYITTTEAVHPQGEASGHHLRKFRPVACTTPHRDATAAFCSQDYGLLPRAGCLPALRCAGSKKSVYFPDGALGCILPLRLSPCPTVPCSPALQASTAGSARGARSSLGRSLSGPFLRGGPRRTRKRWTPPRMPVAVQSMVCRRSAQDASPAVIDILGRAHSLTPFAPPFVVCQRNGKRGSFRPCPSSMALFPRAK